MKGMNRKKSLALVVSLVLVLTVGAGATLAYLAAETSPLANIFNPSQVTTEVAETFGTDENGDIVKSNVTIKNTGDTEAWIRAAVVVTWQNQAKEVYGQAVNSTDYVVDWGTDHNWVNGKDGFWYYTKPVAAKDSTENLIDSLTLGTDAQVPEGYHLTVEIIGSGIQSKPASVFNTEWANSGLEVNTKDQSGNELLPDQWTLKEVSDNG